MRIGIDFDNTLVCYDQLFWQLGNEQGLLEQSVPRRKNAIRDLLRQRGQERAWTALQGAAYGTRILEADPFPHILTGLETLRRAGNDLYVISHKTRTPIAGSDTDLHAAARAWLSLHRLWLPDSENSLFREAHFEPTKQQKLQRIAKLQCDWFIDDLIELLTEPDFPLSVGRILFDPHQEQLTLPAAIRRMTDWNQVAGLITPGEGR